MVKDRKIRREQRGGRGIREREKKKGKRRQERETKGKVCEREKRREWIRKDSL